MSDHTVFPINKSDGVIYLSGQGGGSWHNSQDDRQLHAKRLKDQEGNVPHSGTALQGVSGQTYDHTAQHPAQLRQMHHPQPREEGIEKCRVINKSASSGNVHSKMQTILTRHCEKKSVSLVIK